MNVTIRNIALDEVFKEYKTENLVTLTETQIRAICSKFFVTPLMRKMRTADAYILDKRKTVELLFYSLSCSYYLPERFMEEEHRKIYRRNEIKENNKNTKTGDETFKLFAAEGLGFYNLRPKQSVVCNFPERFLLEDLCLNPIASRLKITTEDGTEYKSVLQKAFRFDERKKKEVLDISGTVLAVEIIPPSGKKKGLAETIA